ncbi:hypothetical protein DFJ74DRAFT_771040 [Hyaloraphidium curvatum]|nr:hypothetical protein DFJ74DRAFT_771040 [Hyaloraphidium curvatum]
MFKQAKNTFEPVLAKISNLPPGIRTVDGGQHLCMLLPGGMKWDHESVIRPLREELQQLAEGVPGVKDASDGVTFTMRGHAYMVQADAPHIKKMAGSRGHNATVSCMFCGLVGYGRCPCLHLPDVANVKLSEAYGKRGGRIDYDPENLPMYTVETYASTYARLEAPKAAIDKIQKETGIMRRSVFDICFSNQGLPVTRTAFGAMRLPHCLAYDRMHQVAGNVQRLYQRTLKPKMGKKEWKKFAKEMAKKHKINVKPTHITDSSHHCQGMTTQEYNTAIEEMDHDIVASALLLPSCFGRVPRSLVHENGYKTEEWFTLLKLYYVPLLHDRLLPEDFEGIAWLVRIGQLTAKHRVDTGLLHEACLRYVLWREGWFARLELPGKATFGSAINRTRRLNHMAAFDDPDHPGVERFGFVHYYIVHEVQGEEHAFAWMSVIKAAGFDAAAGWGIKYFQFQRDGSHMEHMLVPVTCLDRLVGLLRRWVGDPTVASTALEPTDWGSDPMAREWHYILDLNWMIDPRDYSRAAGTKEDLVKALLSLAVSMGRRLSDVAPDNGAVRGLIRAVCQDVPLPTVADLVSEVHRRVASLLKTCSGHLLVSFVADDGTAMDVKDPTSLKLVVEFLSEDWKLFQAVVGERIARNGSVSFDMIKSMIVDEPLARHVALLENEIVTITMAIPPGFLSGQQTPRLEHDRFELLGYGIKPWLFRVRELVLLNPNMRLTWLSRKIAAVQDALKHAVIRSQLESYKKTAMEMLISAASAITNDAAPVATARPYTKPRASLRHNHLQDIEDFAVQARRQNHGKSEAVVYINESVSANREELIDIPGYWKENRERFPELYGIAREVFSFPLEAGLDHYIALDQWVAGGTYDDEQARMGHLRCWLGITETGEMFS